MSSLGPIGNKANSFESLVPVVSHFAVVVALPALLHPPPEHRLLFWHARVSKHGQRSW